VPAEALNNPHHYSEIPQAEPPISGWAPRGLATR
jgi:hypothetical protein